ncbi:MAG: zinc ribbon domain-containing protein [Chloroflexota bacterium]
MHDDELDPVATPVDQPADAPQDQPAEPIEAAEPVEDSQSATVPSEAEAWVVPPPPPPPNPELIAAHSVPATPLIEGTQCPRCGTENRPGIAFCRSCGQRLMAPGAPAAVERPVPPDGTQACPRCGTHNRAGVAFCQNCGANLRPAADGSAATEEGAPQPAKARRAFLGPLVLLIGAGGMLTAWLLPFAFGGASLWDRAYGAPGGYGLAFWRGYPAGGIQETAYFGLAAPVPILSLILLVLALAGLVRSAPATLQRIGLLISLLWGVGLAALFVLVELIGGPGGDLLQVLRSLSPGGIIFLLAGLIVLIGSLTRLARA